MSIDNCIENKINHTAYGDSTVYIMSYVKIPESTPVGIIYGFVAIGFVIDYNTDIIEDLVNIIKLRLHVASQKSICVALRDIDKKYQKWKKEDMKKLQTH
jgi:hypothetical protein